MRMRNLHPLEYSGDSNRRGSVASGNLNLNPLHAKYKGIISTPGYCKFSAWKRETEIPKQTFSSFILGSLVNQPTNKVWIRDISTGRTQTYQQARTNVEKIKQGLYVHGLKEGSVVCMWTTNFSEYWLVCLAAWELGAAIMPVNCLISLDKLEAQLKETETACIVCDELNVEDAVNLKSRIDSLKKIFIIEQDACTPAPDGVQSVQELMKEETMAKITIKPPSLDKDPIYYVWTVSGDEPVLVQHTNRSMLAQMFSPQGSSNHWLDQVQGDTVLGGCWFFHTSGLYSFALSAVHGISLYVLSDYSDENLLAGLSDPAISTAVLYPWQLRMLSQSPLVDKYDLSHLRLLITGGSLLGQTIKIDLLEKLPNIKFIRESYGLKETGFLTLTYTKDKSKQMNKVEVPDDHQLVVGLPNMWTVVKVVDRVSGNPVTGPDVQGELCVKTCQLMCGYRGRQGNATDAEGFFHTGDLGFYDKDGAIHFVEQISNLISFWMYEVSPSVLESRLLSHSAVVDAAVVGIHDKENGQIPRGFVVLKSGHEETEENLTNFLESRLQDHERLRGGLHYIQHIPRDENWKVVRPLLQQFIPPPRIEGDNGPSEVDPGQVMELPEASPRSRRASEAVAALLNPQEKSLQHMEPQDTYGMRSRSRRGSQENILGVEEEVGHKNQQEGAGANDKEEEKGEGEELQFWLPVSVSTRYIEKQLLQHPAVKDVAVRGVKVQGIGQVPRAYIAFESGAGIPGEEIACWANNKLAWHHRLFGGLVVTERLGRDSEGSLLVNLDTLDRGVVAQHVFSPLNHPAP